MKIDGQYLEQRLRNYRYESAEYRGYREDEWVSNHDLYYSKPETDSVNQRQSVSTTLVKTTLNTVLSQLSDSPDVYFDEVNPKKKTIKGNEYLDNEGEIKINAAWREWSEQQNIKLKDRGGKKNAGMYGRDIKMFDIESGEIILNVVPPTSFLVGRDTSAYDVQCGRFLAVTNIRSTISEIEANPNYDQNVVEAIKEVYSPDDENVGQDRTLHRENPILADNDLEDDVREGVGDDASYSPNLGETQLELQADFIKLVLPSELEYATKWLEDNGYPNYAKKVKNDGFVWYRAIRHDEMYYLSIKPVIAYIGINKFPGDAWAYDVEDGYFWSYGVVDDVRPNAEITNVYFSQMLENRALQNYNMHWFNTEYDDFNPQSYDPKPGAYLPVPGDPNQIMKPVQVNGIEENLTIINWLDTNSQRASGATSLVQGIKTPGEQTLGEIQLLNDNAAGRITPMREFYTIHWKKLAEMWVEILMNNADSLNSFDAEKINTDGTINRTQIDPSTIKGEFKVNVTTLSLKRQKDIEAVQLYEYLSAKFPVPTAQQKIGEHLIDLVDGIDEETKKQILEEIKSAGGMGQAPEQAGNITAGLPQGDNAGIASALAPQAGQ